MKYRKKVLIEAFKFEGEMDVADFGLTYNEVTDKYTILTKQGWQDVNKGDYLIINPDGEVYPCNPKTFLETYEEVSE